MPEIAAPPISTDPLDAELLDAHSAGDGPRLASLYGEAADRFSLAGNIDAACFYWTQALLFALEAGLDRAGYYAERLRRLGRI